MIAPEAGLSSTALPRNPSETEVAVGFSYTEVVPAIEAP